MVLTIRRHRPHRSRPLSASALLAMSLFSAGLPQVARAEWHLPPLASIGSRIEARTALPAEYRPGVLLLRDDGSRTLHTALIELARRPSGRKMLDRLLESGFITVLVSERLRPMQAGLWGPLFNEGEVVGAVLYLDLLQIQGLDHDPSGVETLAHEIRHQVDASRAFTNVGTYKAVYRAAAAGDKTKSAQRYARRVRLQRSDLTPEEARRWLQPRVLRLTLESGEVLASSSVPLDLDSRPGTAPHQR